MPKFKCVTFDWDGTLADSTAQIVSNLQKAITDLAWPARSDTQLRQIIGLSFDAAIDILYPDNLGMNHAQLKEAYMSHFWSIDHEANIFFEGVEEMLADLKAQGILLAVATGKSRKGLDVVLEKTNTAHLFSTTRCADQTRSKPDPLMLEEILTELDLKKSELVMVGDTTFDLQMANNAQVAGIGVATGAHDLAQLEACNPLVILSDIRKLPEWVL